MSTKCTASDMLPGQTAHNTWKTLQSTSQWASGKNVSPDCGHDEGHCCRTLIFTLPICLCFNLSSFPLLFVSFTGKVKQEPSVYRDGPPYQRRGSLQLWQFLVTLLDDPANGHFIAWTGRGMEFKLIEPEEVSPWADICHLVNLKSTT